MRERITGFILVTLIAMTIWLFAESESLGTRSGDLRIEFVGREDLLVTPPADWDGRVSVELTGARGQLGEASARLFDRILRLEPGLDGIPETDGEHTIRLLDVLQSTAEFRRTGVTIQSVRPLTLTLQIRALKVVPLPVVVVLPEAPSLAIEGETRVTPETIEVRMPERLVPETPGSLALIARPMREQLEERVRGSPEGGLAEIRNVAVGLPESLRGVPGVRFVGPTQQPQVTVSFTLRNRQRTLTLKVPVQVLQSSADLDPPEYEIEFAPENELLEVQISGPDAEIAKFEQPDDYFPVAVLWLSSDDLVRGITSKEVGFGVLVNNAFQSMPESVRVRTERPRVSFTIVKAQPAPVEGP